MERENSEVNGKKVSGGSGSGCPGESQSEGEDITHNLKAILSELLLPAQKD